MHNDRPTLRRIRQVKQPDFARMTPFCFAMLGCLLEQGNGGMLYEIGTVEVTP